MQKLSMTAVLTVLALGMGATLLDQPAANALAQGEGFNQPSIMIDQLAPNAKDLPVQSFDAF
jgi:hypothetical protein